METVVELVERVIVEYYLTLLLMETMQIKSLLLQIVLYPYPNYPPHVAGTKVDYICVVDQIGIPEKIATGAAKPTTDLRKLMMAEYCTQFVVNAPYFKDGFSYQTGVGGASIASAISLGKIMKERGVKMGFAVGGMSKPMVEMLDEGLVGCLLDTQAFDMDAVEFCKKSKTFQHQCWSICKPI